MGTPKEVARPLFVTGECFVCEQEALLYEIKPLDPARAHKAIRICEACVKAGGWTMAEEAANQ